MPLKVETHYSGARCVIWRNSEHYIDVRKDVRTRLDIAECVCQGRVYRRVFIDAPEELIELMYEELR